MAKGAGLSFVFYFHFGGESEFWYRVSAPLLPRRRSLADVSALMGAGGAAAW